MIVVTLTGISYSDSGNVRERERDSEKKIFCESSCYK